MYAIAMIHYMNLNPKPFKWIASGKKDVEMRLNDERRKDLKAGDLIEFTNTGSGEKLLVEVVACHPFKDFYQLYKAYPKTRIGYSKFSKADPGDMLQYYPQEKIDRYGALAIEIRLLKSE